MSDFGENFSSDDVIRLRAALGRISRLVDRQVSGDGLTRTQLSVLGSIGRRGPLGISELAESEGVNPTMLSRILGKLEDLGLVQRTPGELDKRAVQVAVTPAGRVMHDRLRDERARLLGERLDRLASADSAKLLAALPALEQLATQLGREEREATERPVVGGEPGGQPPRYPSGQSRREPAAAGATGGRR